MKRLSALLLLLLCFASTCIYADVRLTDEEATQMLNEIQESKKDLQKLQEQLILVKDISTQQNQYYREQLNEAEKKTKKLETEVTVAGTSSAIFFVLMIVFIII